MNAGEHTFPLPDVELHKLDDLEEKIPSEPGRNFIRSNLWLSLGIAGIAGCLLGVAWKSWR